MISILSVSSQQVQLECSRKKVAMPCLMHPRISSHDQRTKQVDILLADDWQKECQGQRDLGPAHLIAAHDLQNGKDVGHADGRSRSGEGIHKIGRDSIPVSSVSCRPEKS